MKKNMKKTARVTSLVMASLLCLSACGKQPAGNSSDDVNPATNSSSVVESTQEEEAKPYWELLDEVSDTSYLPDWDGETLEITVWHASGTDALSGEIAENDIVYKEFERVTGVKFNVEDSFGNGGNNIDAKLPMVIGSGDLPNMILGYDIGKQTSELFENGYLADLTDYYVNGDLDQVTKWLPMDKTDTFVYKNARTENGEYYLIPQLISNNKLTQVWSSANYYPDEAYDNEYHNTYGVSPTGPTGLTGSHTFWVRDDILKELKPDALTWDELANIYKAVTGEDAGELGIPTMLDKLYSDADSKSVFLSTTYYRNLHLFMVSNPMWFPMYTGKPAEIVVSSKNFGVDTMEDW